MLVAAASELFATFDNLDPWCKVNFSHIGMSNFLTGFIFVCCRKLATIAEKCQKVNSRHSIEKIAILVEKLIKKRKMGTLYVNAFFCIFGKSKNRVVFRTW